MLYCGDDLNHLGICVRDTLSLRVFFGNLFFLQTIRVPTLGSDIALWSLAYEFWYYLLFPLGLLMIVGRRSVKTRASYAVVFAAMLFLVGSVVGILFPVWLLGAALVFVPPPKVGRRMRGLCCVLYVPIVFLLAKERSFSVAIADDLLGCATFLLVWVLLSAREKADPAGNQRQILAQHEPLFLHVVRGAYAVSAVCSESVGWNHALDSGCAPFGLGARNSGAGADICPGCCVGDGVPNGYGEKVVRTAPAGVANALRSFARGHSGG